jgi:hypothetical protein
MTFLALGALLNFAGQRLYLTEFYIHRSTRSDEPDDRIGMQPTTISGMLYTLQIRAECCVHLDQLDSAVHWASSFLNLAQSADLRLCSNGCGRSMAKVMDIFLLTREYDRYRQMLTVLEKLATIYPAVKTIAEQYWEKLRVLPARSHASLKGLPLQDSEQRLSSMASDKLDSSASIYSGSPTSTSASNVSARGTTPQAVGSSSCVPQAKKKKQGSWCILRWSSFPGKFCSCLTRGSRTFPIRCLERVNELNPTSFVQVILM